VFGGSLYRVGIGAIPFLLPLMLQLGFGYTPFHSGLLTCASAAGAMFMKTIAARFLRRYGFRRVLLVNGALGVLGLWALATFTPQMPYLLMLIILLVGGCFRSLQFTSLNAISYADVDKVRLSQATSMASVAQQLSIGMGVVLAGFALQMSNEIQGHATLVAQDFWPAFLVVGAVSALALLMLRQLPHNAGAEMAGQQGTSRPDAAAPGPNEENHAAHDVQVPVVSTGRGPDLGRQYRHQQDVCGRDCAGRHFLLSLGAGGAADVALPGAPDLGGTRADPSSSGQDPGAGLAGHGAVPEPGVFAAATAQPPAWASSLR
jgi:hypothetical protein